MPSGLSKGYSKECLGCKHCIDASNGERTRHICKAYCEKFRPDLTEIIVDSPHGSKCKLFERR